MSISTIPFDPAKFLDDNASQMELIKDALENGDENYLKNALNTVARARGMTKVARDAGITREALYKALSEKGDPKLSTLFGVMKALGIRLSAKPAG